MTCVCVCGGGRGTGGSGVVGLVACSEAYSGGEVLEGLGYSHTAVVRCGWWLHDKAERGAWC